MANDSLINLIISSPLDEKQKQYWTQRANTEGASAELIAGLKEALQDYIASGFAAAGAKVDENDPALMKAKQAMHVEVAAAQAEYNNAMQQLEEDASVVQADAMRGLDKAQVSKIKAMMGA